MKKLIIAIGCLISIMVASCGSDESKAKEAVKQFCEANKAGMTDQVSVLYPGFTEGEAKTAQVDVANLTASQSEDGSWKVEDGVNHIFFVKPENGKFVIEDTKNVVETEMSKTHGRETGALMLGMINDQSTDMEIIKAYNALTDSSDLIQFLNKKYPIAKVYGIEVQNIRKKKEGGMGIYCFEAKATLKSGPVKPIGPVEPTFIFKDKNGNVVYKRTAGLGTLKENDIKDVQAIVDLNDYPDVTDVEVELEPFGKKNKDIRDIDLLTAYVSLSPRDYQEFLDQK